MDVTLSTRHCDVTDTLRERAVAVAERLGGLSPHALEATIVFDQIAQQASVEIRLHARGRKVLIGVGEGSDHRTALDRAEEKLRPQVLKASQTRARSRRATSGNS